jgi:hypothetical protein
MQARQRTVNHSCDPVLWLRARRQNEPGTRSNYREADRESHHRGWYVTILRVVLVVLCMLPFYGCYGIWHVPSLVCVVLLRAVYMDFVDADRRYPCHVFHPTVLVVLGFSAPGELYVGG